MCQELIQSAKAFIEAFIEQAINSLSDSERKAVFKLEEDYMLGRITRKEIVEMAQKGSGTMTYEQFVKKSESDESGIMRELSKFAKKSRNYISSTGRDTTGSRTNSESYIIGD